MATPLTAAWQQGLTRHVTNAAMRALILFAGADLMVSVAATLATLPILLYDNDGCCRQRPGYGRLDHCTGAAFGGSSNSGITHLAYKAWQVSVVMGAALAVTSGNNELGARWLSH